MLFDDFVSLFCNMLSEEMKLQIFKFPQRFPLARNPFSFFIQQDSSKSCMLPKFLFFLFFPFPLDDMTRTRFPELELTGLRFNRRRMLQKKYKKRKKREKG